jgi:hypothetical protein
LAFLDARVLIEVVDALGVKQACSALDAVHDVALFEQRPTTRAINSANSLMLCLVQTQH